MPKTNRLPDFVVKISHLPRKIIPIPQEENPFAREDYSYFSGRKFPGEQIPGKKIPRNCIPRKKIPEEKIPQEYPPEFYSWRFGINLPEKEYYSRTNPRIKFLGINFLGKKYLRKKILRE